MICSWLKVLVDKKEGIDNGERYCGDVQWKQWEDATEDRIERQIPACILFIYLSTSYSTLSDRLSRNGSIELF